MKFGVGIFVAGPVLEGGVKTHGAGVADGVEDGISAATRAGTATGGWRDRGGGGRG